jgi:hypothetical protein
MICGRQIAENATKLHTASNMSTTAIHIMTFRPSFSCRALYAARRALFLLLIVLSVFILLSDFYSLHAVCRLYTSRWHRTL